METIKFERDAQVFLTRMGLYDSYIETYREMINACDSLIEVLKKENDERAVIERCELQLKRIESQSALNNAEAVKKDYSRSYERLMEAHQKFSQRIADGEFEKLLAEYKDNLAKATKKKVNGLEQFRKIMTDAAIAKSLDDKISAFVPLENANKHIKNLI
jgi:hypothetical protein